MWRWIRRVLVTLFCLLVVSLLLLAGAYTWLSRADQEIVSSGEGRKYLLYVPANLDSSRPAPLVISLHGAWLYPGMQKRLTRWNAMADREKFIVAYPRARGLPRVWRLRVGSGLTRETQFFSDLIDEISSRFNVDPARIYANGYSNGAAMTFMLSCTLGDRIAAFGMVATPVLPWEWCQDPRPVPMVAFHGTADAYAPYSGGENFLTDEPLPSMVDWFSKWGERNGCTSGPFDVPIAADVELREYRQCATGVVTRLYTLKGSGHVWPGGLKLPEFGVGPYTDSIDATEEMWMRFRDVTGPSAISQSEEVRPGSGSWRE